MPIRADERLVQQGLAADLHRAQALVMEGRVLLGTRKILKPSEPVRKDAALWVKGEVDAYVSRGAHKLKRALEAFSLDIAGKTCVDVGASTGGFTDVMLRAGAARVFAVDVGYNLLDWKLRSDARVTCMERTNARFLTPEMFDAVPEFGATDVSFISLKAVLPAVFRVLAPGADFVALIKPQFEAAREDVGEKGVVRSADVHRNVVSGIIEFCLVQGWTVQGLDFSPITGPEGNMEFLLWLNSRAPETASFDSETIDDTIRRAHDKFVK